MVERANLQKLPSPWFREKWGKKNFTSLRRIFFRYFNEELQNIPEFLFTFYAGKSVWYPIDKNGLDNIEEMVEDFINILGHYSKEEVDLSYYQLNAYWGVQPKATYSFTGGRPPKIKKWYRKWHRKVNGRSYKIVIYSFINKSHKNGKKGKAKNSVSIGEN